MKEKTFVVSHPKARAPLTVKGETLAKALKAEGLDPAIWQEIAPMSDIEAEAHDDSPGDAGPEDN